jgi:hypothetical protein
MTGQQEMVVKSLRTPKRMLENNIKMGLREISCECIQWLRCNQLLTYPNRQRGSVSTEEWSETCKRCQTTRTVRNSYIIVENPEGKRPLERSTCTWVNNIKMYLRCIGCEVVDWLHLA